MFDLEQSISEWRQQMLAAGIKTPVPLEELEIHLREEIERQMNSGADEQTAFGTASSQIGQAEPIKTEFKKIERNVVKRKIGIGMTLMVLLAAAVLQLAGAPLVARMRTVSHQNGHTMVDNFWQIQWYTFVLAGLFVAGIVLIALPKRKKHKA